ncbi:MAG: hypothetical protein OHK0029_08900 [Armatimonadaceae bacterium]
MNGRYTRFLAALVLSGCFLSFSGCSQETLESAKQDVERNTRTVRETAEKVEKVTKPVVEVAKPIVKPVAGIVKKEAERKLDQLEIGARVTAALKANRNLPQTIRVDADADAQGVKLRGTVETAAQKKLAEKIARETIGKEQNVQNDLVVESAEKATKAKNP